MLLYDRDRDGTSPAPALFHVAWKPRLKLLDKKTVQGVRTGTEEGE